MKLYANMLNKLMKQRQKVREKKYIALPWATEKKINQHCHCSC